MKKENIAEEVMGTTCTCAIVFRGKIKNLYDAVEYLKDKRCIVIYKKTSMKKLIIIKGEEK